MAMEVAQIAAWEWDVDSGPDDVVDRPETLFGFPDGGVRCRICA